MHIINSQMRESKQQEMQEKVFFLLHKRKKGRGLGKAKLKLSRVFLLPAPLALTKTMDHDSTPITGAREGGPSSLSGPR